MTEGVGFLFEVPSMDKVPEVYDDGVCAMSDFYQDQVKHVGENDFLRKQSLQQFREWIAKHPRIKRCRTDAPFLLRFLRTNKYSFMNAAKMLECFLTARNTHQKWFHNMDVDDPDLSGLIDAAYLFPLPTMDSHGRVVFFSCSAGFDIHKTPVAKVIKLTHMLGEIYYDTNEVQCAGCVLVYDMEKIDMNVLSTLTIQEIRILVNLTNSASALRIQELHFVNTPKVSRAIANLVLQLMSEKIRSRVFCHSSLEDLHTKVDKAMLPKEFGGTIPAVEMAASFKTMCQKMRPRLLSLDGMDIEVTSASSDMWKDNGVSIGNGAIGSFRMLQVD